MKKIKSFRTNEKMQIETKQIVAWCDLFKRLRPNSGPLRSVLYTNAKSDLIPSFGIVIYCYKTDKILLIKKPHTYQYYEFVRALWRSQDLFFLIHGMSNEERSRLRKLDVEAECERLSLGHVQNAKAKYEENLDLIVSILDQFEFNNNLPYSIPKGRANSGETGQMAAIREFEEETGLKPFGRMMINTMERKEFGCGSKFYLTQLWVYIVNEEVKPPSIKTEESLGGIWISRRMCSPWIDLNSLATVLSGPISSSLTPVQSMSNE